MVHLNLQKDVFFPFAKYPLSQIRTQTNERIKGKRGKKEQPSQHFWGLL